MLCYFLSHLLWCFVVGLNVYMYNMLSSELDYYDMVSFTVLSGLLGLAFTVVAYSVAHSLSDYESQSVLSE